MAKQRRPRRSRAQKAAKFEAVLRDIVERIGTSSLAMVLKEFRRMNRAAAPGETRWARLGRDVDDFERRVRSFVPHLKIYHDNNGSSFFDVSTWNLKTRVATVDIEGSHVDVVPTDTGVRISRFKRIVVKE